MSKEWDAYMKSLFEKSMTDEVQSAIDFFDVNLRHGAAYDKPELIASYLICSSLFSLTEELKDVNKLVNELIVITKHPS